MVRGWEKFIGNFEKYQAQIVANENPSPISRLSQAILTTKISRKLDVRLTNSADALNFSHIIQAR